MTVNHSFLFTLNIQPHIDACCEKQKNQKKGFWFLNPAALVYAVTGGLFVLSYFLSPLHPFRHTFLFYAAKMWWAILLGFFLGGIIDYFVPKEYVSKYLAEPRKRTIFLSVCLGLLMSACSHGILALAIELHKKGASGAAVISFLLASPWANLPVTFLLIGFFGWKGLLIICAACFVALTTGLLFQLLAKRGWVESNPHSIQVDQNFSVSADILKRFKNYRSGVQTVLNDFKGVLKGSYELTQMVAFWIVIGVLLAALTSAFVPKNFFAHYFGASLLGLLMTVLVATILEVCSEGTSPLAFELYRQTGAFGNAFAFLMAGVVTDYTEIGLIWTHLGKRSALWMLTLALPQVILIALSFNIFFK